MAGGKSGGTGSFPGRPSAGAMGSVAGLQWPSSSTAGGVDPGAGAIAPTSPRRTQSRRVPGAAASREVTLLAVARGRETSQAWGEPRPIPAAAKALVRPEILSLGLLPSTPWARAIRLVSGGSRWNGSDLGGENGKESASKRWISAT
ncbi:hypothetical protein DFH09DRAFT_1072332 [Mycena vulgaris]|nr:hypothetical protein DFH09DRAFT_1072332 [Mycena vulgaris]